MNRELERVYVNDGNQPLIDLLSPKYRRILDVGCGAGDNAILIKAKNPECEIYGITHSVAEAELARKVMAGCWVFDIEGRFPEEIGTSKFDVLIFSHVLE